MNQVSTPLQTLSPKQRALYELLLRERKAALRLPDIQPRKPAELDELSSAQRRLWFLDQYEPASSTYNIVAAYRLSGPVNLGVLQQSLTDLMARHESLRVTFENCNGTPMQRVHRDTTAPLAVIDLQHVAAEQRSSEAMQRATAAARKPFDLGKGPLFRSTLFCLDVEDHLFMMSMHHIVSDGWSMGILFRELQAVYSCYLNQEPSLLASLPIQYADFAKWEHENLSGEWFEQELSYWRKQLEGAPSLIELPADHARPGVPNHAGAHYCFNLPEWLERRLESSASKHGATLFMVLLAAFNVLLWRLTNQEDIVVGSPIAGRDRTELEQLVGFFINMQPLRTDLGGNPTFTELLQRVREVTLGAYAHQKVPFERLVEALHAQRNLSSTPLFNVVFALHNAPDLDFRLPGTTSQPVVIETGSSKFDLALEVSRGTNGLLCMAEYSTELFESATIRSFATHFETLLESIAADPNQRIGELQLLPPPERNRILVEWNSTAANYPRSISMHSLVEKIAGQQPDALCVADVERHFTYGQLNERANQLAHYLLSLRSGANRVIAICAERSAINVLGLLAIWKAGAAYLPIDPAYPKERIAFMLESAGVEDVLAQETLRERLPSQVRITCLDQQDEHWRAFPTYNPVSSLTGDDLAYVIFTSGSTGKPKAVELCHRGLLNLVTWHQRTYDVRAADRATQLAGQAFDAAVWELWPYLGAGASIHIPDEDTRNSATALWQWLAENAITISFVPTPLAEAMLETDIPDDIQLRFMLTGGDRLRPIKKFSLPFTLVNHYGPTENTVVATSGAVIPGSPEAPTIGRPIANTQVYLLDARGEPVPTGVAGELYIGGDSLALGYRNQPQLTSERFVRNRFNSDPASKLYRTGDLARYRENGDIDFVGRIDDQVKIRGFRIELGEIESVLRVHPAVRECVVVVRDTAAEKHLVAYVSAQHSDKVTAKELQQYLEEKLPAYMVPAYFVFLERLPLNQNGKIDRHALPLPDFESNTRSDTYVAPHTRNEQILADIWSNVLKRERIGIHDNFFELGGDSILSIQVIAKASQAGLKLTPKQIFQQQTIAELGAVATSNATQLEPHDTLAGPVLLTPIQRWFFDQELGNRKHFNQHMLLALKQRINATIMKQALSTVVEHHDSLRLRYEPQDGNWQPFYVDPAVPIEVENVDLSGLAVAEQERAISAATLRAHESLDFTSGPVMRTLLFDCGPDTPQQLLWVIHHLVVDGVSWGILLEDLETAYIQIEKNEPARLPRKTTSFHRWAELLSEYAQKVQGTSELQYWLTTLEHAPAPLPIDFPDGQNTLASETTVESSLSADETSTLLHAIGPAQAGMPAVLLTAVFQAFAKWTGIASLLVNMEGHGREDFISKVDLSRTVGWFTSLYPVHLRCRRYSDPRETLKSVSEQLRNVPNHGIGYGVLRYLANEPDSVRLRRLAVPQVAFNYLGQFGRTLLDSRLFSLLRTPHGKVRGLSGSQDSHGIRKYLIDIHAEIADGTLITRWTFSANCYRRESIDSLVQNFNGCLRALIHDHQQTGPSTYVPSDFSAAGMSRRDLQNLVAGISGSAKGFK